MAHDGGNCSEGSFLSTVQIIAAMIMLISGAAAGLGAWANARDAHTAERVWAGLRHATGGPRTVYDPSMVAELPQVVRRYFARAIMPGTPLATAVELEMEGTFILNGREFLMQADQIIAVPHGFVWRARIGSGLVRFGGSDGYRTDRTSWTRFWLLGLVSLARVGDTEDHARASAARMTMEAIWTPAALLPQNGAEWRQVGPDRAEVSFPELRGIAPVVFTFDRDGSVIDVVTQRWSDANSDGEFRFQPFGGSMLAHNQYGGFTIPSEVEIGDFFGTDAYSPFFRARLTRVSFR